ncbi:MAG: aminoglycoside phosphotransferase family protein [Opitutae bacterium]
MICLKDISTSEVLGLASLFELDGIPKSAQPFGNGNVNDTFLVTTDTAHSYTLQRINHDVFKDPVSLMDNFARVTTHLAQKHEDGHTTLQTLVLVPAKDGSSYLTGEHGNYWRITEYVPNGLSLEVPETRKHAYEAARAFGDFQYQLSDLPGDPLIETIPDFHNTVSRYQAFNRAVEQDVCGRAGEVTDLISFAQENEHLAGLIRYVDFPTRTVHNDTKLNNVLLHKKTGKGICVVDLDTVMPGCALHDFADLVRTAACSSEEDEPDISKIHFLPERFSALVDGYLAGVRDMLEPREIVRLAVAPQVITYELCLRFLTDFLQGDTYFKVKRPGHNFERARAQFQLLRSMQEHQSVMEDRVSQSLASAAS